MNLASQSSNNSLQDMESQQVNLMIEACSQSMLDMDSKLDQITGQTRRGRRGGRRGKNNQKGDDNGDDFWSDQAWQSFFERVKTSRLNMDLKLIIECFQGNKNLKNVLSDKFDDIEQEFLGLHKFNFDILSELGYAQSKRYHSLPYFSPKQIYQDPKIIERIYGRAYRVEVQYFKHFDQIRKVQQNFKHINFGELNQFTSNFTDQDIFDALYKILHSMCNKYNKSIDDIAEIFVKVSGDLEAMKYYLEGKRVTEWSMIEDLHLSKNENSSEFNILVKTKGLKEIEKRQSFLFDMDNSQIGGTK